MRQGTQWLDNIQHELAQRREEKRSYDAELEELRAIGASLSPCNHVPLHLSNAASSRWW